MQLSEFFKKYARNRGVLTAEALAVEIRKVLSVRAAVRRTKGGNLVAINKAKPFAPPRMITGKLRNSVKVVRTAHGARVVIYSKYGAALEYGRKWAGWPHKFLAVAMHKLGLKGRHSG